LPPCDDFRRISWMNNVEVRQSSIEGLGIFATRALSAGERICRIRIVREITPEAPIREELGERYDHCAYPDGRVVLIGFPERHVNHSCDPNAYERFENGTSQLVARRYIEAGDEVTIDYDVNISGGTAWPCRCGAVRCLGEVLWGARSHNGGSVNVCQEAVHGAYRPFMAPIVLLSRGTFSGPILLMLAGEIAVIRRAQ